MIFLSIWTGRASSVKPVANARVIGMASLLLVTCAKGQFEGNPLSGNVWARGVVITTYQGTGQKPAMVFRANTIFRDYQRKSFFRIGLLPIAVIKGVDIDVRSLESITNSLAQLDSRLGARAARRLELRQVTIQIAAAVTNRLQAGRIQILPGGKWELDDDVRLHVGTNQVQAAHATLQVTGDQIGTLAMSTTPAWSTNFFGFAKSEP